MYTLLWIVILTMFVLWLVGIGANWGNAVWVLFVVGVVLLLFNLFGGKRVAT